MISAYRVGLAAGSTAYQQNPTLAAEAQRIAAQEELSTRKALGIAHLYPEEEFLKGFVDGYHSPVPLIDGLTLYRLQYE